MGWPTRKDSLPWIPVTTETNGANLNSTNSEGFYDPPSLHLTVLNSTSVLVNWSEPPHPKEVHVKGFRITYSTKSERVNDIVFFGPITIYRDSAREYLFSNLGMIKSFYSWMKVGVLEDIQTFIYGFYSAIFVHMYIFIKSL